MGVRNRLQRQPDVFQVISRARLEAERRGELLRAGLASLRELSSRGYSADPSNQDIEGWSFLILPFVGYEGPSTSVR